MTKPLIRWTDPAPACSSPPPPRSKEPLTDRERKIVIEVLFGSAALRRSGETND